MYTDNIVEDAFRGADCTGAGTQGAVELRLIRTEQFGEDIFKSSYIHWDAKLASGFIKAQKTTVTRVLVNLNKGLAGMGT